MIQSVAQAYHEAVRHIESLGVMPERAPSLLPTQAGLKALGFESWGFLPDRATIVAGTNGKGSTCATLEALLLSAGRRVGFYSSPHLIETTERFRLNGAEISREDFLAGFEVVRTRVRDVKLTHFEWLTLMAAWLFCSGERLKPVDHLVLEVGLGGLWDATNAIPHSTCVLTPLALDHENLLGAGIENIARAKFGVVSAGSRVIYAPFPRDLGGADRIECLARELQKVTSSEWNPRSEFTYSALAATDEFSEPEFTIRTRWGEAQLALPGERGAENAALALAAFEALGFDPQAHLSALSRVSWPGRMQKVTLGPGFRCACPVYASGDHNPHGVRSLLALLKSYRYRKLHVLASAAKDKTFQPMFESLAAIPNCLLYLTVNPFRGAPLSHYGDWLTKAQGAWESPEVAFRETLARAQPGDRVLVTGSLYLVGEILKLQRGTS